MYIYFARRDGTVNTNFHDGTGRYTFFSTTGRDGTFFFRRDGTVHFCFHDGTARYANFFTAAQESAMQERTALGIKVAVLQVTWYTSICYCTNSGACPVWPVLFGAL